MSRASGLARTLIFKLVVTASMPASQRGDDGDIDAEIGQAEHGRARHRAARTQHARAMLHAYAGCALADFLYDEDPPARVDLGETGVDKRLDVRDIEAARRGTMR